MIEENGERIKRSKTRKNKEEILSDNEDRGEKKRKRWRLFFCFFFC